MAAGNVTVLGPFPPTQFDKASDAYTASGNSKSLNLRMTEAVGALTSTPANITSVEPIVVLGNVYLVVYQKGA